MTGCEVMVGIATQAVWFTSPSVGAHEHTGTASRGYQPKFPIVDFTG